MKYHKKKERVVIVGTRKDILPKFVFPEPKLNEKSWVTLEKAIGDLENLNEGDFTNHFWSKAKKNKGQGNSTVSKTNPVQQ